MVMARWLLVLLGFVHLLFAATFTQKLIIYLDRTTWPIDGVVYIYDFDHDGAIDYNDWIYQDLHTHSFYRILGKQSTSDNLFGLLKMDQTPPSKTKIGYFIHISMPHEDPRYSWIYIDKSGHIYKLQGATQNGFFKYLDIDGDGKADPLPLRVQIEDHNVVLRFESPYSSLSIGWSHTCILKEDIPFCWGDNRYGELGIESNRTLSLPTQITDTKNFKSIDASKEYTCAIDSKEKVWCFGRNEYGKLGNGKVDKTQYPLSRIPSSFLPFEHQKATHIPQQVLQEPVSKLTHVKSLALGSWHGCAVKKDGTAWCWGQNFSGALGIAKDPKSFLSSSLFDLISDENRIRSFFWPKALYVVAGTNDPLPLTNVKQLVSGSSDHSCALLNNGKIKCWGYNGKNLGELGIDQKILYTTAPSKYVVKLGGIPLDNIQKIVAGADHTCALDNERHVLCWGKNDRGQLGDGTTHNRGYADYVRMKNGKRFGDIKDIFANQSNHTCAINLDGKLFCWGDNAHGELGLGFIGGYSKYPKEVNITEPVRMVSAGGGGISPFDPNTLLHPHINEHTCALTLTDELYCWGNNEYGQLGTGDYNASAIPKKVNW